MHLKFDEHLEGIRPLMALEMRCGCRTKHRTARDVPTNFGTEVNGQCRHEVETHRYLAIVCTLPDASPINIVEQFRARVHVQQPMNMNDPHSIGAKPFS